MRNVSYKRVSTTDQNFSRQLANVDIKFDKEFSDKLSGKDTNRPELKQCLDYLQEGDWLWVHEISRLSRSVEDLRMVVTGLMDKGVSVKFVKEGLEFTTNKGEPMKASISKLMLTLIGSIGEFEREISNGRTREGVQAALARGVKFGASSDKYKETHQRNKAAGLHKTPVRKVQQPELLARIRQMVGDSNGSLTQMEMTAKLNAEGWTSARGKVLSQGMISKLLKEL